MFVVVGTLKYNRFAHIYNVDFRTPGVRCKHPKQKHAWRLETSELGRDFASHCETITYPYYIHTFLIIFLAPLTSPGHKQGSRACSTLTAAKAALVVKAYLVILIWLETAESRHTGTVKAPAARTDSYADG